MVTITTKEEGVSLQFRLIPKLRTDLIMIRKGNCIAHTFIDLLTDSPKLV